MYYTLHKNGCWDICGEAVCLRNVYPAINGRPLSPVRVSAGDDFLLYELETGRVKLQFSQRGSEVEVACSIFGVPGIHDMEPVAWASVEHAAHVFVQGARMGGPSGCHDIEEDVPESSGLIALYSEKGAFFVYGLDHRRYANSYSVKKTRDLFGEESVCLSGGFNLEYTADGDFALPSLFFTEEKELAAGLRGCAGKIAAHMGARTHRPPVFHWCSWYYLYENLDQQILEEYMGAFQKEREIPFRYIQIDAGYAPSLGDWLLPNHRFPEGLQKAAETIRQAGYVPGIWIGPFMVGDQSRLYKDHPDWVLHDRAGRPVTELASYNEPKMWGNRDGNYYVLDASHPGAMAYLREVFCTLREWGFRLFKTDFMVWNMHDTSKVRRYDPGLTSVEILRNTLQMIRESIGEDSYLLGCIAPFLPFIGYADGMRIAGDVGAQWGEDYGPVNMIRELAADNYFNHVYWQNDPDSVLLRDVEIHLKPHEIRSLALYQALSGGAVTTSDPIHRIGEDRRELLRFIIPDGKVRPRLPYLGQAREDVVLLHELEQGNLLYALNPTDRPLTVVYRLEELFGERGWYIRRYGRKETERSDLFTTVLQPHDSVLLFLTKEPLEAEPENLWKW